MVVTQRAPHVEQWAQLKIAIVGGLDRHERHLVRLAGEKGHEVECHRGHASARSTEALEAMVDRAQVVVLVTMVNSHGAIDVAKRAALRLRRRIMIERTCGPARFAELLRLLDGAPT